MRFPPFSKAVPETKPADPEFDFDSVDCEGFYKELRDLRAEIRADLSEDDLRHLYKFERIGRVATAVGVATAWVPNPVSVFALAVGRATSWMLMHHVGHRGYDRVPGVPERLTSRGFAMGNRRFLDWPDWMLPEAWKYEHNVLHHAHTGEERDPDLIERNTELLRSLPLPRVVKLAAMGGLALTWRFTYYAPNTIRTWLERGQEGSSDERESYAKTLWLRCYAPYALLNFVALPALMAPLGPLASASALLNSLGAEALTNLHTFIVIGPNHTGDDLYRFDDPPRSKAEGAVRQVIGSVNYRTGTEAIDFAHLWLNYQIEHHLFPDIPMLQYRKIQPRIMDLCEKYGIPYVQESVWLRAWKMLEVAVGAKRMKRASSPSRARHENSHQPAPAPAEEL